MKVMAWITAFVGTTAAASSGNGQMDPSVRWDDGAWVDESDGLGHGLCRDDGSSKQRQRPDGSRRSPG
jgi:hypothetical protein